MGKNLLPSSLSPLWAGFSSSRAIGLRASVFGGCWLEVTFSSLHCEWQFASSMSARESASELEVTVFCNLITKVTAPPCCHILLVRSYSRGGVTRADGYEEMGSLGADFGLICCQPQPIQLIKSQHLIQGWVSNQSQSELGLRYLLEPSGKWHCWSSCVGRRR